MMHAFLSLSSGAPEGIEAGENKRLMNKNPDVASNWRCATNGLLCSIVYSLDEEQQVY
jgi:hypothetical protein